MPANVENMFSVIETPWHNIGTVVAEAPSIAEGIKLAGLDWKVMSQSLLRADGENVDEFAKVFVRSDNNKTLAVVGPNTHPLQNVHAFDFFEDFVKASECKLETAGSLDEGRKIWVMAKIQRPNSEIVKGDEVAKFVLLSNSHDGTTAVRVGYTPIRVVCANTLAMAHSNAQSKLIRIRHTSDVKKNVDSVRETMKIADEAFEATAEQYRFLANRSINENDLRKYVKLVFKLDENDSKVSTRSKNMLDAIVKKHQDKMEAARLKAIVDSVECNNEELKKENKNILEAILLNMEAGKGTDNAASRGSFWTAYNAVTEYLNYERGNTADTRLNSLWFGQNAKANADALQIAIELAEEKAG